VQNITLDNVCVLMAQAHAYQVLAWHFGRLQNCHALRFICALNHCLQEKMFYALCKRFMSRHLQEIMFTPSFMVFYLFSFHILSSGHITFCCCMRSQTAFTLRFCDVCRSV
jgi:hypothetical protein